MLTPAALLLAAAVSAVPVLAQNATMGTVNATAALCAAQAGDCSKCLAIPACTFCSPTVTKQGICVLREDKSKCLGNYGFPIEQCDVGGLAVQWWFWIAIGAGIILLLSLLICCCCWCRNRGKRRRRAWLAKQEAAAVVAAEQREKDHATRKEASTARAEALRKKYGMTDSTEIIMNDQDKNVATV